MTHATDGSIKLSRPRDGWRRCVNDVAPLPCGDIGWQALAMDEPFTAVVVMGLVVSLALGAHFWRLAPAVSIALAGGIAGAIAGLVGWVFVPENLQQLDLIDGGLQASYGDALPAVARGFTVGLVIMGLASWSLGRPPTGSRDYLRRVAVGIVGLGLGLAWGARYLLEGACARRVIDSCSENVMVAVSIIVDAVAIGPILTVVSPSATTDEDVARPLHPYPPSGGLDSASSFLRGR
jgi:hypothetical protein